jgi:hypothetical protein
MEAPAVVAAVAVAIITTVTVTVMTAVVTSGACTIKHYIFVM